jgi:hypothetical protein
MKYYKIDIPGKKVLELIILVALGCLLWLGGLIFLLDAINTNTMHFSLVVLCVAAMLLGIYLLLKFVSSIEMKLNRYCGTLFSSFKEMYKIHFMINNLRDGLPVSKFALSSIASDCNMRDIKFEYGNKANIEQNLLFASYSVFGEIKASLQQIEALDNSLPFINEIKVEIERIAGEQKTMATANPALRFFIPAQIETQKVRISHKSKRGRL